MVAVPGTQAPHAAHQAAAAAVSGGRGPGGVAVEAARAQATAGGGGTGVICHHCKYINRKQNINIKYFKMYTVSSGKMFLQNSILSGRILILNCVTTSDRI